MYQQELIERVNHLITMGEEVLKTRDKPTADAIVESQIFHRWMTSSLFFLEAVFGKESAHLREFKERCHDIYFYEARRGQGILEAARDDIQRGHLKKLQSLVSADIFSDFLEMAEHLVQEGYKDAAAMLIGAVLEDGLRTVSKNNGIAIKKEDDIGSLDQKLSDAKIYSRLVQKQIRFLKNIRDNAAHGKFSEYSHEMVEDMLRSVRAFLGEHL